MKVEELRLVDHGLPGGHIVLELVALLVNGGDSCEELAVSEPFVPLNGLVDFLHVRFFLLMQEKKEGRTWTLLSSLGLGLTSTID